MTKYSDNNTGYFTVNYEQGDTAVQVDLLLKCINVPAGSTVSYSCPQVGPEPPIQLGPVTVTNSHFICGAVFNIPAGFTGTIAVGFSLSSAPPAGMQIELYAVYAVTKDKWTSRLLRAYSPQLQPQ